MSKKHRCAKCDRDFNTLIRVKTPDGEEWWCFTCLEEEGWF